MNTLTNLPTTTTNSHGSEVKLILDKTFQTQVSFPSNEIDVVLGFFIKNGFDESSAQNITIVLLNQAKLDNVNIFTILDTLKTLNTVQLSQVVTQILNSYREKTSTLGYRIAPNINNLEKRNVLV